MNHLVQWPRLAMPLIGLVACGSVQSQNVAPDGAMTSADGPSSDAVAADGSSSDAAATATSPSCVGLARTCGSNHDDSCCTSLAVPSGTYYRSYDVGGDTTVFGNTTLSGTMNAPATVDDFRLDKYEVTVGRFRAFVTAGMGTRLSPPMAGSGAHANIGQSGWDPAWNTSLSATPETEVVAFNCDSTSQLHTWTETLGANENRPMNCITWYEAMAFCAWDGGYLPTEAEWNYAAAGGSEQRVYPWSVRPDVSDIDGAHASYSPDGGATCVGDGAPACAVTDLVEVGSKLSGDGRWGQADLAGNVGEWTLDWFVSSYITPCTDCANLTPPSTVSATRVIRGGDFADNETFIREVSRAHNAPATRGNYLGVRCARAP